MDKVLAALQLNKPAAAPVVVVDEPEAFGFDQEPEVVVAKKAPVKKKLSSKKK